MIGVCGAGSFGSALAISLAASGTEVLLWGRESSVMDELQASGTNDRYLPGIKFPASVTACKQLDELIARADILLLAIPSEFFANFITELKPKLKADQPIAWVTKGLNPSDGKFLHEVVETILGTQQRYAAISGPSFAKEVAKQMITAVVVAGNDTKLCEQLRTQFSSDTFRMYQSDDLIGVEIGGALKNILAVATGIADGLGFGANTRAALITRGIAEIRRFASYFKAKPDTLLGLSGIGDIILTCSDNQSRNRRFGLALAKGLTAEQALADVGQAVESYSNILTVYQVAQKHGISMPITEQLHAVLYGSTSIEQALNNLVTRTPGYE